MAPVFLSLLFALYASLLASFAPFYKDMRASADLMESVQALYTAESAAEKAWYALSWASEAQTPQAFLAEASRTTEDHVEAFLLYNQEAPANVEGRALLNDGKSQWARVAYDGGSSDGGPAFTLPVARASYAFAVREAPPDQIFNELVFEFGQGDEEADVLFEVIAFPREGDLLNVPAEMPEGNDGPFTRFSVNTRDSGVSGRVGFLGSWPVTAEIGALPELSGSPPRGYRRFVRLSGLQPMHQNHLFLFQTLNNEPVHSRFLALRQGVPVVLPHVVHTVEVTAATGTGLYQRLRLQKMPEGALMPGLQFTHFSQESVHK